MRKRILALLCTISMIITLIGPSYAYALSLSSDGYYEISSGADFNAFVDLVNNGDSSESLNARLTADIDLGGAIYSQSIFTKEFAGILDGNGKCISNFSINVVDDTETNIGLFSSLRGTVQNLSLSNVIIDVDPTLAGLNIGAIAGTLMDGAVVNGCTVNAYIKANSTSKVGAVAGYAGGGEILISDCMVLGNISAQGDINSDAVGYVGGILGFSAASDLAVSGCNNRAVISGFKYVAGILAYTENGKVTITSSNNYGEINAKNVKLNDYAAYFFGSVSDADNTDFYKAWDGDVNTAFIPTYVLTEKPNWFDEFSQSWALEPEELPTYTNTGLTLTGKAVVTKIRLHAVEGESSKMLGGQIQGTVDGVNWITLYSIKEDPGDASFIDVPINNYGKYMSFRYMNGSNQYNKYATADIAEIELYGILDINTTEYSLTGLIIATSGSDSYRNNQAASAKMAWDGNPSSYFDPASGNINEAYTMAELYAPTKIAKIRYMARENWSSRMLGGKFQGSNDGETWTDLYQITKAPGSSVFAEAIISDETPYKYIRYTNGTNNGINSGGRADVAEIQLFGGIPVEPEEPLYLNTYISNTFGSVAYQSEEKNGARNAWDGNASTEFLPNNAGSFTTAELNAPMVVNKISFLARNNDSYRKRLNGAHFQGSNDGNNWTTLYTITSDPPKDSYVDVELLDNKTPYKFYRMYAPNNFCDVREISLYYIDLKDNENREAASVSSGILGYAKDAGTAIKVVISECKNYGSVLGFTGAGILGVADVTTSTVSGGAITVSGSAIGTVSGGAVSVVIGSAITITGCENYGRIVGYDSAQGIYSETDVLTVCTDNGLVTDVSSNSRDGWLIDLPAFDGGKLPLCMLYNGPGLETDLIGMTTEESYANVINETTEAEFFCISG